MFVVDYGTRIYEDDIGMCKQQFLNPINAESKSQYIFENGATNKLVYKYKIHFRPLINIHAYKDMDTKLKLFKLKLFKLKLFKLKLFIYAMWLIENIIKKAGYDMQSVQTFEPETSTYTLPFKKKGNGKEMKLTLVIVYPQFTGNDFTSAMGKCSYSMLTYVNVFPEHIRMFLHLPVQNSDDRKETEMKKKHRAYM
ncbi:uncharacterized protein LOC127854112 isoform X2 [Dreissena polymorpha]|uniref:uncharacterized protein LOC127854112 isoform X2 n=1 Tax=Dreissena polymorpha TaxID=45954 RepID=UPI002264EE93|nr:uncharacterized protein LOC127854112 isoform X2 [Dreissena polymorpha]